MEQIIRGRKGGGEGRETQLLQYTYTHQLGGYGAGYGTSHSCLINKSIIDFARDQMFSGEERSGRGGDIAKTVKWAGRWVRSQTDLGTVEREMREYGRRP